jgi:hypothetical protein
MVHVSTFKFNCRVNATFVTDHCVIFRRVWQVLMSAQDGHTVSRQDDLSL